MASDHDEVGDDLNDFAAVDQGDVDDRGSIDLEPGEHYIGEVTDFAPGAGSHGLLKIDGREVWLNATLKNQLVAALVENQTVAYVKSDDEETFTDDEGEERSYHPREFRFKD
jgi:hypothetical protein